MNRVSGIVFVGWVAFAVFAARAEPPQGCLASGCHAEFAKRKVQHSPAETGQCEACHENADKEKHKFKLTTPGEKLCLECHEEVTTKPKHLHGPVAAGGCTLCHDPHASANKHLLLEEGTNLCTQCHDNVKEELEGKGKVHEPVRGDCLACHTPHGADNPQMLRDTAPKLCLECHSEIGDRMAAASVHHSPVTSTGSCLSCHKPHSSPNAGLLAKEQKTLCLGCHADVQHAGEREIRSVAAELKNKPNPHAPVDNGACTSCHDPHGSATPSLLARAFPSKMYAPFDPKNYALCFECHETDLASVVETDSATGFRNGQRNLHYVHVNKADKGRTCRVCHEVHASTGPKLIAESVKFGQWSIPIRFQPTATGGSCQSGCHRPYRYDRDAPIERNSKF